MQFRDADEVHHYGLTGCVIAVAELPKYPKSRTRYAYLDILDEALAGFDESTLVLVVERDELLMRASLVVNI